MPLRTCGRRDADRGLSSAVMPAPTTKRGGEGSRTGLTGLSHRSNARDRSAGGGGGEEEREREKETEIITEQSCRLRNLFVNFFLDETPIQKEEKKKKGRYQLIPSTEARRVSRLYLRIPSLETLLYLSAAISRNFELRYCDSSN